MEPGRRQSDDGQGPSQFEYLLRPFDCTKDDGLRRGVRNAVVTQVYAERPHRGNEDSSDRPELLDALSQSEHLGLEGLLVKE